MSNELLHLDFDKPKRFFFHYNKPASKTAGKPQLSVHVANRCLIVNKIICFAHIESKNNKRQPHCVMTGRTSGIHVTTENEIIIYGATA